ncbi:MAG: hypothetical protein QGF90_05430, partial [Gammaproteobacteria bacterium]|nr:hypothetical protein [Gammaproteobacteria bacterium]
SALPATFPMLILPPDAELAFQLEVGKSPIRGQHGILVDIIDIIGGVSKSGCNCQHSAFQEAHKPLKRSDIACLR